jgi:putative endonuclease
MYYLYILHSETANRYFIGTSEDPKESLNFHNTNETHKYTGKFADWKTIALFECGDSKEEARKIEDFITKQKNKKLLMKLIDSSFTPADKLEKLKRIAI